MGKAESLLLQRPPVKICQYNRVRTIYATLQMSGNALAKDRIAELVTGRPVLCRNTSEAKRIIAAYDNLNKYNPCSLASLIRAHQLIAGPQKERLTEKVRFQLRKLLEYLLTGDDILLVKACMVHYQILRIRPFSAANGRLARLWQISILKRYNPVFEYLPVEEFIYKRLTDYDIVLNQSDNEGNATAFLEYMLEVIDDCLEEFLSQQIYKTPLVNRIQIFRNSFDKPSFRRADYLACFKNMSPYTASRDLRLAVQNKVLEKCGTKRTTVYKFPRET